MGQKVNPHGLRVGVIKDWDSKWIAGKKDFGDQLVEDYNIRKFVKKACYDAGVAPITGNGEYTVSVTVDTNAIRYDATGDVNGDLVASGTAFMAVQIMDGATATPNAVIEVTSVKIDGTEIPLTKKSYTNTEETEINGEKHNNIRSNIYNRWVSDDKIADARSAEGNISDLADKSAYSATILDPSAIGDWKTVEVTFNITGM